MNNTKRVLAAIALAGAALSLGCFAGSAVAEPNPPIDVYGGAYRTIAVDVVHAETAANLGNIDFGSATMTGDKG
ncbi:hypothetical protein ACFVX6_17920 [Streptomyces sp. NPDC058289]|uniref:hypothetical protein n=1 Tax=Streptomyces sp. NPDC058289 TaxID=3346425 RepID=UPI0036E8A040